MIGAPPEPLLPRALGRTLQCAALLVLAALGCAPDSPIEERSSYVGGETCTECHAAQADLWAGSHHDLAMTEPTSATVLGDFSGTTFEHRGVTTTFTREGDTFRVRTEGPNGDLVDYEVAYAFGVAPLQQYLVEFPGGRLQTLGIAWDSRSLADGGQRWFHLYPEADTGPDSPLHWTRPAQNWNTACAECHSTNLDKGYDADSRTYSTSWSDLDVSCEACHGPASAHVELARDRAADRAPDSWALREGVLSGARDWRLMPGEATAVLSGARPAPQVDQCAACHSRRGRISSDEAESLHDRFRISLLDDGLYHADGQIREEVYVYGSFVQSKMYAAGVTCSDCHEPHSLELRATGNALCSRCHSPAVFDVTAHHKHAPDSEGALCVECHMPETVYMGVDARRDHGIRIPQPEVAERVGAPDACTRCHSDRSVEWARGAVESWWGTRDADLGYAEVISRARLGDPVVWEALTRLASNPDVPPIRRGTLLAALGGYPVSRAAEPVRAGLADPDPLVRLGAIQAAAGFPSALTARLLTPLVADTTRVVRLEVARVLGVLPDLVLAPEAAGALDAALTEFERVRLENADQAGSWVALGDVYAARGDLAAAEAAYRGALGVDSTDLVATLNLADLQRAMGSDDAAEELLTEALQRRPGTPELLHALGLLRVRQGDLDAAVALLERSALANPDNSRFSYVYGVALVSSGDEQGGTAVLERALARRPFDRDLLSALTSYARDAADLTSALSYAERLAEVAPDDSAVAELVRQLRSQIGR